MTEFDNKRPQIGAMFRGPGPAKYALPGSTGSHNHDFQKRKMPSYIFGLKTTGIKYTASPGPAQYKVPAIVTRNGKEGSAKYGLHDRTKSFEPFMTPGPGSYKPESQRITKQTYAAQYSFGLNLRKAKKDSNPAPNAYSLETMTGNLGNCTSRPGPPCYTLSGRTKINDFTYDFAKTPGPGQSTSVNNVTKRKAPVYSMGSRSYQPGDSTQKPAPNAHSREKVNIIFRKPYEHSFGVRHSVYTAPVVFALE